MQLGDYLHVITDEAARMRAVAELVGLAAPTPTCPKWNIRKLLLHTGEVHRWATAAVAGRHTSLAAVPQNTMGDVPADDELIAWFGNGAAKLVDTLATADNTVDYGVFLKDPPTPRLLFWARRQAMEISMHRVDAESALGRSTPFAPTVAADGIDEFLTGFITRGAGAVHRDSASSIGVAPTDSPGRWTVTIDTGPIRCERQELSANCTITGTASDIYLALWNRGPLTSLGVAGDRSLISDLRHNVHIRWS